MSATFERDLDQLLDLGLARTCRIGVVDRSALVAMENRSNEVTATDPACSWSNSTSATSAVAELAGLLELELAAGPGRR